ncbi:hypothetical protein T01_12035 [Trichinella spiralis]|uniref:Uncharacterized protein n=1 Tax=Trichinella spiralis TaxID=6334 RepID=A0A0V1BNQ8_TRISP|nr:hypothetical protein T01_12035 [Trichinella spiralis]
MATEARRSIDYWGQYNWTRPSNRIGRVNKLIFNRWTKSGSMRHENCVSNPYIDWWGVAWSDCVSTSKFDRLHWQA